MFNKVGQLLSLPMPFYLEGGGVLPLTHFEVQLQRLQHLFIRCPNVSSTYYVLG